MGKLVSTAWCVASILSLGFATRAGAATIVTNPFVGIQCTQRTETSPRLLNINVVEFNLKAAGLSFCATPANGDSALGETDLQTTQSFLEQTGAQMAVNTNFFGTMSGGGIDICGILCSNGVIVSPFSVTFPAINISYANAVAIMTSSTRGVPLYTAVAGNRMLVTSGVNTAPSSDPFDTDLHPRTAIGVTSDKSKLIIMTVDGRRSGVSLGVTTPELAGLMLQYGAYNAINLDGGGSTQLAIDDSEPRLANIPSESPRAVGANMGIYATRIFAPAGQTPSLIACESFDYSHRSAGYDGAETPSGGGLYALLGGSGWAGGWKELQTAGGVTGDRYAGVILYDQSSDVSGNRVALLNYTDVSGRMLRRTGGQLRTGFGASSVTTRYINTALVGQELIRNNRIGADGTVLWLSFLAQSYNTSTGDRWSFLQLGNGVRFGRITGSSQWGIQDAQNTAHTAFGPVNVGEPVMYLAKLSFRNGNDLVQVWLNPRLSGESKLPAPDMEMSVTDFTFSRVAFIGNYSTDFDELRIGTTFEAAAPTVQGAGDANGDGKVDVSDLGILAANYGETAGSLWTAGDFNDDGAVDVSDLGILAANYGQGSGSSAAVDFNADYGKAFDANISKDGGSAVSSGCGGMGLPLAAGLVLMGLMLVRLDDFWVGV